MAEYTNFLTQQEKQRPYAKYFTNAPVPPSSDRTASMAEPIDSQKALSPENINSLLQPGYHDVENGWCVMKNGIGFVACRTEMPQVTPEMLAWWFAWHALEPLRYKIWWPEGHLDLQIDEEARKRIRNPDIPLLEKNYGVTHTVLEDIGGGAPDRIRIQFKSPADFGFDVSLLANSESTPVAAGVGYVKSVKAPFFVPQIPAIMCHMMRKMDQGIELRTRFWMGCDIINRKPKKKLPPFVKVPAKVPKGLANHCIQEYTNLAALLPQIYKEQQGKI